MKKLIAVLIIILTFVFVSCSFDSGNLCLHNKCPWAIYVRVYNDDFDETVSIGANKNKYIKVNYNQNYTFEISDSLSYGDYWTVQEHITAFRCSFDIKWEGFTYVVSL